MTQMTTTKRCLPMQSCDLRTKCDLAMVKLEGNVLHFSPTATGEHCPFFRAKRYSEDDSND